MYCIHASSITSTWHIDVLAFLWLVAHLNGQVGWVSLHLLSLPCLFLCWWPLPFWSCFSFVPLQSLVHHCMHHCTDCAGGQWQRQHKWQEDWQHRYCHCNLWTWCYTGDRKSWDVLHNCIHSTINRRLQSGENPPSCIHCLRYTTRCVILDEHCWQGGESCNQLMFITCLPNSANSLPSWPISTYLWT